MRKSKMLAKFRQGKFARVCSMGHVLPFYIRYAAHYGFEGIWLDLEHRNMTSREVQYLIQLCHYNDIDCMVRPPTREFTKLYRYLEDGATGFLMPHVSTPELAEQIVQATKFPPIGNRGMDGAGLDGDYGLDVWKEGETYIEDSNRETFNILQIETEEGVANAEEIASLEGVDGLFVGPADLGIRFKAAAGKTSMTLDKAVEMVASAAEKHGKIWSIVGSKEDAIRYRSMGAQMIPWGGDFALMNVLKDASAELDEILESAKE